MADWLNRLHKPSQCVLVCFEFVGKGVEGGPTLVERGLGPFSERLASGINGSIEIFLRENGDLRVGLTVCRVDAVTGLGGGGQLIVDDIVEGLHVLADSHRGGEDGWNTIMSKDMMMD